MPKKCGYKSCKNPAFSKGRCKWHRVSPQKNRGAIKKRSKKRTGKDAVYTKQRKKFLETWPVCQICDEQRSTDIHHTHAGPDRERHYLDTDTWMALCRNCHQNKVHLDPKNAREMGWLK